MLTLQEVAKELRVSELTVNRWLNKGKLKGFKVGHKWRIREEDLDDFIKGGENIQTKEKHV